MEKGNPKLMDKQRFRKGISLAELLVTMVISMIPTTLAGILLVGGERSWTKTYQNAYRPIELEAQTAISIFGRIGRKSYADNCVLYTTNQESQSQTMLEYGDALELGYYNFEPPPRMRNEKPIEYAYFYLDKNTSQLKVDYKKHKTTAVLANNVTDVRFTRTRMNNTKQGCVRMKLTLTDPADNEQITAMAATLLRN